MGAFYGKKIQHEDINTVTGKAWTIKDVPAYWQEKVKTWLSENS